jgi:16S rRNA (adenine1518-N6/adenine1519-N6)-dimethyltransferase
MKPSEIARLLEERGFRPRRSLGQNFLFDRSLLCAVADAGEVGPGDFVLEVGTGAGTLTAELARRAAAVATVETDPRIQEVAREVVASNAGEEGLSRVRFIGGDALAGETGLHPEVESALRGARERGLRAKCVSNFPYSIATPLFVRLLERSQVERAWDLDLVAGMVQREVAERLTARAISKEYGVPPALVQALARVELVRRVGPRAFSPPPKVESAVVRIVPRSEADRPTADYRSYRDLVRQVFRFRRKTVRNALLIGLEIPPAHADAALARAGVAPEARVESLSIERLAALAAAVFGPSLAGGDRRAR